VTNKEPSNADPLLSNFSQLPLTKLQHNSIVVL
jgi:hypothetical protein